MPYVFRLAVITTESSDPLSVSLNSVLFVLTVSDAQSNTEAKALSIYYRQESMFFIFIYLLLHLIRQVVEHVNKRLEGIFGEVFLHEI